MRDCLALISEAGTSKILTFNADFEAFKQTMKSLSTFAKKYACSNSAGSLMGGYSTRLGHLDVIENLHGLVSSILTPVACAKSLSSVQGLCGMQACQERCS